MNLIRLYNSVTTNVRTKNIIRHIGFSSLYKMGTIVSNFLLVPISIDYLDTDAYGVWLTISTFILWFSFFDVGLGNGLRNRFAESIIKKEKKSAKSYVSTAYISLGVVSSILIILFLIINPFVNWSIIFNSHEDLNDELQILVPVVFIFFAIQLILKLIISLNQAIQNHSINDKIQFYTQFFSLLIVLFLLEYGSGDLIFFGFFISLIPLLLLIFVNLLCFKNEFKDVKPSFKSYNSKYLKSITGLGFGFFITKVGALLLLTTDTFIISQLYGPEQVVNYNIVYKYFSVVTIVYGVIINPFWSSFTEAFAKKDFIWIRKSINNVQRLWLLIPLALILMIALSNWFYNFWVGREISISINLSISVAIFALLYSFNQIYNQFINGVGKIRINLILSLFIIFFNIPLSFYFSKVLGLGVSGVVLGSCLCMLMKCILLPIQYFKIINKKAKGYWSM